MALLKYILKKMLMLLPVLVGISIIAFALGIMSPGDPVDQVLNPNGNESYTQAEYDAMAAKMGLDQPAVVQYFNWVDGLAHGDLGRSFFTNKSVMDQLAKRIPISLKLAGFSMILTIVFGVGSGVLMAVKKDRAAGPCSGDIFHSGPVRPRILDRHRPDLHLCRTVEDPAQQRNL